MKAIVTIGVSASGKSTAAREYVQANPNAVKIDRDDLRFSLRCANNWGEYKFDKRLERMVTLAHEAMVRHAGDNGMDVFITETCLTKKARSRITSLLRSAGYGDIEWREFPISLEEAIDRDSKRQYSVGESVIRQQHSQWLTYMAEKYEIS